MGEQKKSFGTEERDRIVVDTFEEKRSQCCIEATVKR